MDTVRNFFSPVKHRPDPPVDAQTPASQAATPWKNNEIQARSSAGRISIPASNDRARTIASPANIASPAAIAAAKYAIDDSDDDEPSPSEEAGPSLARSPSAHLDAIPLPLPSKSPRARRPGRTSGAHLNSGIDAGAEQGDGDEEYGFKRFLDYRQTGNYIEIQVEWDEGVPTWEPEINLHRDAPETLFDYWKSQGGRPLNPEDPELFDIFAIRKHSKNKKRLQVEWLGYDKAEWTWLPSQVVEETAHDVVVAYWDAQKKK